MRRPLLTNKYATGPDALMGLICMAAGLIGAALAVLTAPSPAAARPAFTLVATVAALAMTAGGGLRVYIQGPGPAVPRP